MGRPPIGKVAMSAAERMRLMRERQRQARAPRSAAASDGADAAQWAQARARIADLEKQLTEARLENAGLVRALRDAKAAKPKPEKAVTPDEAAERRIKAATTELRNLKAKLRGLVEHYETSKPGVMPIATVRAIAKALHVDHRRHASTEEHEAACELALKLFNAWRAAK